VRFGVHSVIRARRISSETLPAEGFRVAIKGGDLIHVGNKVLIDRAQTAGPGDVTIGREKIYELGNYYSLASILDTPDMSFSLESFDVSAEFEALLLNKVFTVANGTQTATITGGPTGGDFDLTYDGSTTTALPYNASVAVVQAALEALTNVAPGDLIVSGSAGSVYTIAFTGNATAAPYVAITADATGLTGGTTPAVVISTNAGVGMANGVALNPAKYLPMDIASAFKPGFTAANAYDVIGSVAIPYLALESLSYRFGISDQASQSATLKGDSIYYAPGTTFVEETTGTNTANQVVTVVNPAIVYRGDTTSGPRYALSVSLASGKRLLLGADYTEVATGAGPGFSLAVTVKVAVPTTDAIRITYSSNATATFPQTVHAPVTAVRPAAIKGRNVEIFIGGTQVSNRWTSVQSVNIDWKVTLEKDEELGNANFVSQTFDTPDVNGSVELKPRDYAELYTKICQIAGVTAGEVAGPLTTQPLQLLVVLHSPDTGAILKSIEVPDARFTLPGYSGQAGQGQKISVTFNFESDTGQMLVYKGAKP
jgi:hypothetical protein